jgi:hypothetical protein
MAAAAAAAAMALPIHGDLRLTEDNHRQATQELGPPVRQMHLVCALPGCNQSTCCLSYDVAAGSFILSLEQICAQIAAHVRQCHNERVVSPLARSAV